jgi:ferredoxin
MKSGRIAKVEIDRSKCLSNGYCVDIAAQVFSLDDDFISVVGNISLADDSTLMEAARTCPSVAIIVKDEEGNQLYPEES